MEYPLRLPLLPYQRRRGGEGRQCGTKHLHVTRIDRDLGNRDRGIDPNPMVDRTVTVTVGLNLTLGLTEP